MVGSSSAHTDTVHDLLAHLEDWFLIRTIWMETDSERQRMVNPRKAYPVDKETGNERHPKSGASWEGYVVEGILTAVEPDEAYFWATHQGAEIDLVLVKHGRMYGVECKRVDAPALTPSMRIALEDLKLERIAVVFPGTQRHALSDRVEAVPLAAVLEGMDGLFPR